MSSEPDLFEIIVLSLDPLNIHQNKYSENVISHSYIFVLVYDKLL